MNAQLPAVSIDSPRHPFHGDATASERFGIYRRLHRVLRGRYRYLLPAMAAFALVGAIYGFRSQHPIYRSEGMIHVAPTLLAVVEETDESRPLDMYNEFIQSQVLLMGSRPVLALALTDPELRQAYAGQKLPTLDGFSAGLTVEHPIDTEALQVTYRSPSPIIAAASNKAVINAYLTTYGESDNGAQRRRLQVLSDKKRDLTEQIAQATQQMEAAATIPSANSIAVSDELMKTYLTQQTSLEMELNGLLSSGYGENRPAVVSVRSQLEALKVKIESYRKEYAHMQLAIAERPSGDRPTNVFPELRNYEQQLDDLHKELDETVHRLDVLKTEASLGVERMSVTNWGDVPVQPYADHRKTAALLCGGVAGMVPLLLFICFGAFDRRYRFSDDTHEMINNVPLLGVVPELPERMLYPDMANIAARCVHNLRVRLQLLGRSRDHKLFMITSATAGEGKTSLTLALGYSFASSGTRTLLIDCDVVGRGLTHRLKREGEPGLTESLDQPGLQNVKAAAKNLWLLPVGQSDELGATSLSPEKLRELIDLAADAYDIVLVDTGPVLSSLEAPLVAQMADHVILTIAQGQQQQCVHRAMRLLRMIGAPVAGFVFNRASTDDYHRSVGGASNAYYKTSSRFAPQIFNDAPVSHGISHTPLFVKPQSEAKEPSSIVSSKPPVSTNGKH